MFALKLSTFVVALEYNLIIPVMPFYMENLGAGAKELGWLKALYVIMGAIALIGAVICVIRIKQKQQACKFSDPTL